MVLQATSRDRERERFSRRNIFRSERIYGVGFNSPGGTAAIDLLCQDVPKFPSMSILDVGCGSGGAAFDFAQKYDAILVGVDYMAETIAICQERHQECPHLKIEFRQGDIQTLPFEANRFDLAWSRDVFMYLQDNEKGWRNIYGALKPGAYFVYVDFCKGDGDLSREFVEYIDVCNYHLLTIKESASLLDKSGFEVVKATDITSWIADLYREELLRFEQDKESFIQEFGGEDYDHLASRWYGKIRYGQQQDLVHGLIVARK